MLTKFVLGRLRLLLMVDRVPGVTYRHKEEWGISHNSACTPTKKNMFTYFCNLCITNTFYLF